MDQYGSCHFWVLLVSQSPVTPAEMSNHEQSLAIFDLFDHPFSRSNLWSFSLIFLFDLSLWSFSLIFLFDHSYHSFSGFQWDFPCTIVNSPRYQCLCATWCLRSSVIKSLKLTAACRHFSSNTANTSNPDRPCPSVIETQLEVQVLYGQASWSLQDSTLSGGLRWTEDFGGRFKVWQSETGTLTDSDRHQSFQLCAESVSGYGLAVAPFSYLSLCKMRTESGDTFNAFIAHGWSRLVPLAASFCQLPFYYVGFESAWCARSMAKIRVWLLCLLLWGCPFCLLSTPLLRFYRLLGAEWVKWWRVGKLAFAVWNSWNSNIFATTTKKVVLWIIEYMAVPRLHWNPQMCAGVNWIAQLATFEPVWGLKFPHGTPSYADVLHPQPHQEYQGSHSSISKHHTLSEGRVEPQE